MQNYLAVRDGKTVTHIFFNGAKVTETQAAFDKALRLASNDTSRLSMYAVPFNAGPWDRIALIGHRLRGDILADIANTPDPLEAALLNDELDDLDNKYLNAGRDTIPLAVAA